MTEQKTSSQKTHSQYTVGFLTAKGDPLTRTVLIVEGYSTEADIPKIVDIMFPGAVIEHTTLVHQKQVLSFR